MALKAALTDRIADSYEPALDSVSTVTYSSATVLLGVVGMALLAFSMAIFVRLPHVHVPIPPVHPPLPAYVLRMLARMLVCSIVCSMLLGAIHVLGFAAVSAVGTREHTRRRRAWLAHLRADSLSERATHAARVLQEATSLVEELQVELIARTALLEDLRCQAAETAERVADMEQLAKVDAKTSRVLNRYLDEALERRLGILEQSARRREWLIGTIVAVAVGVIAILFGHFVFGF